MPRRFVKVKDLLHAGKPSMEGVCLARIGARREDGRGYRPREAPPGDLLPPKRALDARHGISRVTVRGYEPFALWIGRERG